MAAILFLSGCTQYAKKKDLTELQQKSQETDQEIFERLSRIEQSPKTDPADIAALTERLNKISMFALELERRIQPQPLPQLPLPQMTLGVKAVTVEDIAGLVKKIDELDGKIKSTNITKVPLNSVSFPLGKARVEDLSKAELSKLKDNALRIKEEKPARVEITTWADGNGAPDMKEKVASERAKNVESYYKENAGEGAKIEFLTEFKIASVSGPLWRRADTTMWMIQEVK